MRISTIIATTVIATASASAEPFKQDIALQGLTFHVESQGESSTGRLKISIDGLKPLAQPIEREIDGAVTAAEVADLNADGFPELYIFTQSAGSGSYGNIFGYGSNKNKSVSEIFLPELKGADAKGYMGHDQFAIVELNIARRFPIYKPGDTNAVATGGTKQITYRLKPGEAGWVLRPVKREKI